MAAVKESVKKTNKRLVLTGHGGINKLKIQEKNFKEIKKNNVLIKVEACGINFNDLTARLGLDSIMTVKPPCVLGMEVAGTVEEVGENVEFRLGDRVIGISWSGGWSEYVSCSSEWVFHMPEGMSFEVGAAIPINYLTAYILLFKYGGIKPGDSVLCHMAAGGVGLAVGQLCNTVGDITLYGTCSADKHEIAKKNGYTVLEDYTALDYVSAFRNYEPDGIDIVLDPLGGLDSKKSYSITKQMGKYIAYGCANLVTGENRSWVNTVRLWWNYFNKDLSDSINECKMIGGLVLTNIIKTPEGQKWSREAMNDILKWYSDGVIKPYIDSIHPMENFAIALRRLHERKNIGKVLMRPIQVPSSISYQGQIANDQEGQVNDNGSLHHDNILDKGNQQESMESSSNVVQELAESKSGDLDE